MCVSGYMDNIFILLKYLHGNKMETYGRTGKSLEYIQNFEGQTMRHGQVT